MDDTPARMKPRDDLAGRSAEEIVGREPASTTRRPDRLDPSAAPPASMAPDDESDRRTREIRAEIEQTREEMSETIEAIQERIRPSALVSDAADRVRHSAKEKVTSMAHMAGRRAHEMMNRAEDAGRSAGGAQALPIALIGLGTAWMFWNRSRAGQDRGFGTYGREERHQNRDWTGTPYVSRTDFAAYGGYGDTEIYGGGGYREYNPRQGWGSGLLEQLTSHPIPTALATAGLAWLAFSKSSGNDEWYDSEDLYRGSMGSYADMHEHDTERDLGDMASRAVDSARDAVSRAQEGTKHLADRAQQYASGTRRRIKGRSRGLQHEVQHLVNTNPLLMGAGAFMLGAAVGLVIPETEREHELMGEAKERMFERAQERARDMAQATVAEVKHAAGDAAGRIASEIVGGQQEGTSERRNT